MKRYSAVMLLFALCAAGPGVRAQVMQLDGDGTPHRIGPAWPETTASLKAAHVPAAKPEQVNPARATQTLQLMLDTGDGRLLEYKGSSSLQAVHDYVARNRQRRSVPTTDEATLANRGYTHIRDVNYDPNAVIRLAGCVGFQMAVEFAAGEHIENVAMGAASQWLLVPNKRADMLFVEPVAAITHSNMAVITDRHHYYFELVTGDSYACRRGAVTYSLRLRYPSADVAPRTVSAQDTAGMTAQEVPPT